MKGKPRDDKPVVVITGSSGLLGFALAQRLSQRYVVVGLDRAGPPHPPSQVDCISVDLTSDADVKLAFALIANRYGRQLSSLVHLAAYYDFSGQPSDLYRQVNVLGTHRVLNQLQNLTCEQIVYTSSMLVHAPCRPGQKITEDSPLLPKWDYPQSKVAAERLLRLEHRDIPVLLLRIAGVYDDQCHSIPIANQIQRIYERQLLSHVFPGHLSHGQSFVHLDDTLDSLEAAVDKRSQMPPLLTLLIGEPLTPSYERLQHLLGELIHGDRHWFTQEVPKPLAKVGAWLQDAVPFAEESFIKPWMVDLADDHFELDISRAQQYLQWKPQRTLIETLPKMIQYLKDDPAAFYKDNKLTRPRWLKESA